jgi:hypothetical protein
MSYEVKEWTEWRDMCKYPDVYEPKKEGRNQSLSRYIHSLETILKREINLLETQKMTTEKWHYFKGRESVLDSVVIDLQHLLENLRKRLEFILREANNEEIYDVQSTLEHLLEDFCGEATSIKKEV